MLPRCLPIAVPPARHETIASYLARLANLHGLDGDELWIQVTRPEPTLSRRTADPDKLAALTGRPVRDLAGALIELREPAPNWRMLRNRPQIGCPRCNARHLGGPVFRVLPHHRYVCTEHQQWIGPPDVDHPSPSLRDHPDIVRAQRCHLRLLRRHGWAATYDAVLTAFMICGHLWQTPAIVGQPNLAYLAWDERSHQLIPDGLEDTEFSASRIFAAVYPEAVNLAVVFASPTWRRLAASREPSDRRRVVTEIRCRIGAPNYQPNPTGDPIAKWMAIDSPRDFSPPPTVFFGAPGHARPSQLGKGDTNGLERHYRSLLWFTRKRQPGNVILHHRHVRPVLIREWSTPMQELRGAIWQSQRTGEFADLN